MINLPEFDELTRFVLAPLLEVEEGFALSDGTFVRDLPNHVRQIIMVDFDVRKAKTFRVILGFNSRIISGDLSPNEAGVFGVKYLANAALSNTPINFPCFNREAALKSLEIVKRSLSAYALPWISSVNSVEKIAEIAEDQYPFIKGKLYFYAGLKAQAKENLSKHLKYLLSQPQVPSVIQGRQETEDLIARCS